MRSTLGRLSASPKLRGSRAVRALRSPRQTSEVLRARLRTLAAPPTPPAPPLAPRRAYLVGTPFCGSTVFGQALGAHSGVRYLGEIDRVVGYPPDGWTDEPDATCHYCEVNGQECPVWTPELRSAAAGRRFGELMDFFETELGPSAMVDGSKHPRWLRAVLDDRPVDADRTVVFVTVRSPFAFADSYRKSTGAPAWEAANVWRDVYYNALRMTTRAGLALMVVRYEEFAQHPESVLRPACGLLGVAYEPETLYFQSRPRHDIGGNYGSMVTGPEQSVQYSSQRSADGGVGTWVTVPQAGADGPARPFGGYVRTKWQQNLSASDVEQVLQTPGLVDVANRLGYQLSSEVTAWQRRQEKAAG